MLISKYCLTHLKVQMNTKNHLEFSKNGSEVKIIFAREGKGKESDSFESKKTAFEALKDLTNQKRLNPEEFAQMRDKILEKEELPWEESGIGIEVLSIGIGGPFGLMEALSRAMSSEKPVKESSFTMCSCGKNHGKIRTVKGGITPPINSKEEAIEYVEHMIKEKHITKKEASKIMEQIKNSTLEETHEEAMAQENAENN